MGFFTDMLSGGGDLFNSITPKELRRMVPREIQPGGFNPGRDWLGVDLDGSLEAEALLKQKQAQQQQQMGAQQQFQQSANAPIPGLLGGGAPLVAGLMNPHQTQIPQPQQPAQFQPQGPYGQQAAQMAGLLGNRGFVDPRVDPNNPNNPKRPPLPLLRPTGK